MSENMTADPFEVVKQDSMRFQMEPPERLDLFPSSHGQRVARHVVEPDVTDAMAWVQRNMEDVREQLEHIRVAVLALKES